MRPGKLIGAAIAVFAICYASPAAADLVAIDGHVVNVQATYMPAEFTFGLDGVGSTACPTSAFYWYSNPTDKDKTKAQFSTVLAAFLSGKQVHVIYDTTTVGNKGPGNCLFTYLYIIP